MYIGRISHPYSNGTTEVAPFEFLIEWQPASISRNAELPFCDGLLQLCVKGAIEI